MTYTIEDIINEKARHIGDYTIICQGKSEIYNFLKYISDNTDVAWGDLTCSPVDVLFEEGRPVFTQYLHRCNDDRITYIAFYMNHKMIRGYDIGSSFERLEDCMIDYYYDDGASILPVRYFYKDILFRKHNFSPSKDSLMEFLGLEE